MVEYNNPAFDPDAVFFALSDSTRRDMLGLLRLSMELGVGEIAAHYAMTFAGAAKHIKVLEAAELVEKRRAGKHQLVRLQPKTVARARDYLDQYAAIMDRRLDRLDTLLSRKKP